MESAILKYLPKDICNMVKNIYCERIEELRMRRGKPLCIFMDGECFIIGENGIATTLDEAYTVTEKDIEYTLLNITDGSFYTYENEIKNGYVTIDGGNRVGLAGRAVEDENGNMCIREIFSLNFRFARQIKSCGAEAVQFIKEGKKIYNTIVVSPPGCGKTTLLREIARIISNSGFKVCVVDERNEICAMQSEKTYDVGINTDVYSGFSKKEGISMAIRCLSPQIIIADELGRKEDFDAVCFASNSGVASVCSIHAKNFDDIVKKHGKEKITNCFERFIVLGEDKKIKSMITAGEIV